MRRLKWLRCFITVWLFVAMNAAYAEEKQLAGVPKPQSDDEVDDPGLRNVEPEMVRIPGGTVMMGLPENKEVRDKDEFRQGGLHLPPFEVSKYQVTWEQWKACVRDKGCRSGGPQEAAGDESRDRGSRPVINVSWNDAQDYVTWLQRKTGKAYRLLSEAEWEYAARPGVSHSVGHLNPDCNERTLFGDHFGTCTDYRMRSFGSSWANAFGLHDMHGRIWEWVEDCWHDSSKGAPTDGSAWTADCFDDRRVLRAGFWGYYAVLLHPPYRDGFKASNGHELISFRVARTL